MIIIYSIYSSFLWGLFKTKERGERHEKRREVGIKGREGYRQGNDKDVLRRE